MAKGNPPDSITPELALGVVSPPAVARKMGLAERSARAWAAGARRPQNPSEVARAIVAIAQGAGLGLPTDEHHRAEEICGDLPARASAVQCFIVVTVEMLAERHGGLRCLARAMAGEHGSDYESTVRRWGALAQSKPRSIADLNSIVAQLAKFSRSEIKKLHRCIGSEPGPAGHRQAILAYISLLFGAEKPVVLTPEETLALPALLILAWLLNGLLAVVRNATDRLRATDVPSWSATSAISER